MLFKLAGLEGHTHGDSVELGLLHSSEQHVRRLRDGEVPVSAVPLPVPPLLRQETHGSGQDPDSVVRVAVEIRVWRPLLADL